MKEQWTTTVESVRGVVERATQRGLDIAAELEATGSLCTAQKRRKLGIELFRQIADQIEEQPIKAFLGKHEFGMTDFKRGIVTWLRQQADEAAGTAKVPTVEPKRPVGRPKK